MKVTIRLTKDVEKEVEDHILVIIAFIAFMLAIAFNNAYIDKNNCLVLEPTETCSKYGNATRATFEHNPAYAFIPAELTVSHTDDYREKPSYGFIHATCPSDSPPSAICTYHTVSINPYDGIFGLIGHLANYFSTSCYPYTIYGIVNPGNPCWGLPDRLFVVAMWAVIWFGGYYSIRELALYLINK